MTLDDVASEMRLRFTPKKTDDVVTQTYITAAEWNILASALYLRDVVQEAVDTGKVHEDKARAALRRSRGV